MGWFRANRAFGGRLALFAFALQFCLSFAHIHPEDIYGPAKVPIAEGARVVLPAVAALRTAPAGFALDQSDETCAICQTIYLLGSTALPEPPRVVPLSFTVVSAEHFAGTGAIFIAPRRTLFQSRAPPIA